MPYEVDDATYGQLANLDAFVRRGLANPKTRRKLLEVQKTLNPDIAIPEIDESDPVRTELAELRGQIEKDKTDREENARLGQMRDKWNAGKAFAKKKGFTDESLEKLEAFMETEGILTHQAAIPYYQELHPPPVPATSSGSRWDFFGQQGDEGPDMKLLFEGKDDEFLDKTVRDTLNKVRSGELAR
jgi:DNA primase catalytic subunit